MPTKLMLFNKLVRISVGTDVSRPSHFSIRQQGRDESVPTIDVSAVFLKEHTLGSLVRYSYIPLANSSKQEESYSPEEQRV